MQVFATTFFTFLGFKRKVDPTAFISNTLNFSHEFEAVYEALTRENGFFLDIFIAQTASYFNIPLCISISSRGRGAFLRQAYGNSITHGTYATENQSMCTLHD